MAILRRIFRQDRQSLIVVNAHRILQGQNLSSGDARERRDFDFHRPRSEEEILETIKELLRERIPQWLGAPPEDIAQSVQLLTPMHRGLLGTIQLNRDMQTLLNPAGEALSAAASTLRVRERSCSCATTTTKGFSTAISENRLHRPRRWQDSGRL